MHISNELQYKAIEKTKERKSLNSLYECRDFTHDINVLLCKTSQMPSIS